MLQNRTTLEYTINTLRRNIQDEYPELTLHFVLRGNGLEAPENEALKKIGDHPALDKITNFLHDHNPKPIEMSALVATRRKGLAAFWGKENYLALCQINIDMLSHDSELLFPEAPNRYEQVMCHALGWQAIDLLLKHKAREHGSARHKTYIIKPANDELDILRNNLFGECFALMFLEQYGERGMILQMMKKRSEKALSSNAGYFPELYPLPVAIDAVRLIFKDLGDARPEHHSLTRHAMEMAGEIKNTIDDITLKQWVEFCYCAQEMAWDGRHRNEILSAATYSSDDAYTRTTAYIIAEALNTDVTPLNNPQFYNPFADPERYERLHQKTALATFEALFAQAQEEDNPEVFLKAALEQNVQLAKGETIGYCAPALIEVCHALSNENVRLELLPDLFQKALEQTSWETLSILIRFIMMRKREGKELSALIIAEEFCGGAQERAAMKETLLTDLKPQEKATPQ